MSKKALSWKSAHSTSARHANQIAATAVRNGVQYAVRLDLIRPHLETAPLLDADDEAGPIVRSLSPEQEAADARAEAEAESHEAVQAVRQ